MCQKDVLWGITQSFAALLLILPRLYVLILVLKLSVLPFAGLVVAGRWMQFLVTARSAYPVKRLCACFIVLDCSSILVSVRCIDIACKIACKFFGSLCIMY